MPLMLKDKPHEQIEKNNNFPLIPETSARYPKYPNPLLILDKFSGEEWITWLNGKEFTITLLY
jgi:hypothetical protein